MPDSLPARFPLSWDHLQREPYRLLFPVGFMLAAIGIGAWIPFYFNPTLYPYPGQGHATLQIQGFLLCFILGFLTTMLPKVLGVKPLGFGQFIFFPLGLTALSVLAWFPAPGAQISAQILHLLLIGNFLAFILRRWPQRKSAPPSTFLFIPMAFAADLAGTGLRLFGILHVTEPGMLRAASLLQYQAFPLLLILGIGGFLLPKLFGNAVADPQSLRDPKSAPLIIPLAMGAGLLASFALEAAAAPGAGVQTRLAYLLRAGVWAWFTLGQLRLLGMTRKPLPYLVAVRISLLSMGLGMALPALFPAYLIAWEHLIFISGFLWLTLSVAARVLTAHAGRLELLEGHRKKILAHGILIALALISRVATGIWTRGHWLHLACAAAFALGAMAIWGRIFLPLAVSIPGRPSK